MNFTPLPSALQFVRRMAANVALLCAVAFPTAAISACGGAALVTTGGDSSADAAGAQSDAPIDDATDDTPAPSPDASPDAGDPNTVDAGQVVVASVAPCLVGGSVVYLDGDPGDPVHPGTETFRFPSGSDPFSSCAAGLRGGLLSASCPAAFGSGSTAIATAFGSANGAALTVGVYENAIGPSANHGTQPFMNVQASGDAGGSCGYYPLGRFQIEQLELGGNGDPVRILISFEQQCTGAGGATLRGCIRVVP
jgi:hypothetical protein